MIDVTNEIKRQVELAHIDMGYEETKDNAYLRKWCLDMYRGDQLPYIEKYCSFDDYQRNNALQYAFTNITQKIINRVCLTYLNVPIRTVDEKTRQERYNKITKLKRKVMIELDRYSELLDRVGVKLEWDAGRDRIKYRKIIDSLYIDTDQYGDEVTSVFFPILPCKKDKAKKHKIMYEYWDLNNKYILDYQGKPSENQADYGFKDNVNYYGILPVAIIEKDGFYAKSLANANEMINAGLTQLNELVKYKSFGVPYATGVSSDDKIKFNHKAFLLLDENQKAGVLTPGGEIVAVVEAIKFQVQLIAESYGVTFNWSLVGNVSGFSLMVQNIELYDQIKFDNEIKREWEQEIFRIENRIVEVDAKGKSYGDELNVNFQEYKPPVNPSEQDAHENHLIATGQSNPIELMMQKNPDLTEEEAKAKYDANMASKKANTQAQTPTNPLDEALLNAGE